MVSPPDKKKGLARSRSQNQIKIIKKWVVKEEDPEVAMVCMAGTGCSRRASQSAACNPILTNEPDSDGMSDGHVTPMTDEEAPPINKNTGASSSPVLQSINGDSSHLWMYWLSQSTPAKIRLQRRRKRKGIENTGPNVSTTAGQRLPPNDQKLCMTWSIPVFGQSKPLFDHY